MPEIAVPGDVQGPETPGADESRDTAAVNILLLGADSGNLDADSEISSIRQVGRSDTMMWVHIPGNRQNIRVMSIMRDTWVPVPGYGDRKVNAAFALGGVPLAVRTVENMFQARIDHVVAVDMVGFRDLVNSLGGVTVNNPRTFTSGHQGGTTFEAGQITLTGEQALAFARERYAFNDGDYSRVANQQRLVKAIIDKALSRTTLSNPAGVQESINSFAPYLTFDSTLDSGRLFELGWSMRNVRGSDINVSTVPTNGTGWAGDQSVVWPDWGSIRAIGRSIRTGDMSQAAGG
ncbi:MAG: LCP family protein [Micrococcus sp.]|nr:LCP family protein [Micrococcus sp.]